MHFSHMDLPVVSLFNGAGLEKQEGHLMCLPTVYANSFYLCFAAGQPVSLFLLCRCDPVALRFAEQVSTAPAKGPIQRHLGKAKRKLRP